MSDSAKQGGQDLEAAVASAAGRYSASQDRWQLKLVLNELAPVRKHKGKWQISTKHGFLAETRESLSSIERRLAELENQSASTPNLTPNGTQSAPTETPMSDSQNTDLAAQITAGLIEGLKPSLDTLTKGVASNGDALADIQKEIGGIKATLATPEPTALGDMSYGDRRKLVKEDKDATGTVAVAEYNRRLSPVAVAAVTAVTAVAAGAAGFAGSRYLTNRAAGADHDNVVGMDGVRAAQ